MGRSLSYKSIIPFALILVCVLAILVAWRNAGAPFTGKASVISSKIKPGVDSIIRSLRSGDVIVRTGSGPGSELMALMNTKNKTYSHCGLVIIENGNPFVYHCIGGEENPNATMRRDSAALFLSAAHSLGFGIIRYDLSSQQLQRLAHIVNSFYSKHPKFDLCFDLKSNDRLYCSEFVYKAINAATDDSLYINTTTAYGHTYVAIDNLFENTHAHFVCKVRF